MTNSPFIPSRRMKEKRRSNPEHSSQPHLRIQHYLHWEEQPTWVFLNVGEWELGGLHTQGACLDVAMFTVVGTALGRSCSALWTSWGEMWVQTAKKCYLGSWVPFLSFIQHCKKKKNQKTIYSGWQNMLMRLLAFSLSATRMWIEEWNVSWEAGSPLSGFPCVHANAIVSWSGSSAEHWRVQFDVCSNLCAPAQWELREGCEEGQSSLLQTRVVNSSMTYLNFAQKSLLHYSLACLDHVNKKIHFNSERKVTQRSHSLFPC